MKSEARKRIIIMFAKYSKIKIFFETIFAFDIVLVKIYRKFFFYSGEE